MYVLSAVLPTPVPMRLSLAFFAAHGVLVEQEEGIGDVESCNVRGSLRVPRGRI